MTSTDDGDAGQIADCRFIRTVAALERLTGRALTADLLARKAAECARHRCLFAGRCQASAAPAEARPPIPLSAKGCAAGPRSSRIVASGEKLPFSRCAGLDVLADKQGNHFERRLLPLDRVDETPALAAFFRYWQWLRSVTPCRLRDIDVAHLMRAGLIGTLHIADVVSADPQEFSYELIGHAIPMTIPTHISRHPVGICADATMRDYNTARLTAAPRLQRIRAWMDGVGYHYTRLILPFMNGGQRVSHLAVAIHREPGDAIMAASSAAKTTP